MSAVRKLVSAGSALLMFQGMFHGIIRGRYRWHTEERKRGVGVRAEMYASELWGPVSVSLAAWPEGSNEADMPVSELHI